MKQSHLFTTTRKEAPADEVAKNASLLIRAGYIHKDLAGVYSYLPLGRRVIEKITAIIRKEMETLGGQEVSLAALQRKETWTATGRWEDSVMDNWFKTEISGGGETGLATTHEEPLTLIASEYVNSYRDLPFSVFQFQTKFRNEARAKSGIMRGREFIMKDLYSFSKDVEQHNEFYQKVSAAYERIFAAVGIGEQTYVTYATGGSFSKYSHEFQTVTNAGEDVIYIDDTKKIAINKEIIDDAEAVTDVLTQTGLSRDTLIEKKSVEVGNIFTLGTRFSEPLGLFYLDEKGELKPVFMGSYGIGVPRLMGVIVELLSDDKGIVWPKSVAPFAVHILALDTEGPAREAADGLYASFQKRGIEVLYDDRDRRPGEKFADADLIGIPVRVVVSKKSLETGGYEIKDRATGETKIVNEEQLMSLF